MATKRKVVLVDCPNRECKKTHKLFSNENHFVWVHCDNCGRNFFANPKSKQMHKLLKSVDSRNPDNYVVIHREELDLLVDTMLLLKDIESVEFYTNLKISHPDIEWFVRKKDEEDLYPLVEMEDEAK